MLQEFSAWAPVFGRPTRRTATILVVEDDEQLREMYRSALSFVGFAVRDVPDGLDALRWIDAEPPDLIILDLDLPFISGFTVQAEIAAHAQTRDIPIIVATGLSTPLDHLELADVLRKPISPDRLVVAVKRCLG
jgi:DNA-binding response OmpR family regulator